MDKKSTNIAGTAEPASNSSPDAPAQPVVTVVETPINEPNSTTAAETMPATDPVTGAPVDTVVLVKPPKKKKTGLIVSIIIIILLLLGGIGFAIWYFAVYQSPENVVFDSVNKLITAEHVSPHGSFTTTIASDNGYDVKMTVSVESSSTRLPNEASVWLMLSVYDDSGEPATDEAIKLNVGTVQMADGVAYLKIENLTETFEQLLPNIFPATNCPSYTDCIEIEKPVETALYEVAELIDDEWWQISLNDILDELDMLEDWQAEVVTDIYTCSVDAMNADYSDEIALLYRDHRFITVQAVDGGPLRVEGAEDYIVTLDYEQLAEFLNATQNLPAADAFRNCYNAAIDRAEQGARKSGDYSYTAEDFDEMRLSEGQTKDIQASDLEKYLPDAEDFTIVLSIDTWSHELRQFEVIFDNGGQADILSIAFDYSAQPEVSAPTEYRPITELFEEVIEIVVELFSEDEDVPELPGLDFELPVEIGV